MSELKSGDFLLVNRGGVDYKITLQKLADYLQVAPRPDPDPLYHIKLNSLSVGQDYLKLDDWVAGTTAGWKITITRGSTEHPQFFYRVMKNCTNHLEGENWDAYEPACDWVEYNGEVQDIEELVKVEADWISFYIEDKAICGDEVQQFKGRHKYICWPRLAIPGRITETRIGEFNEDNVKLTRWLTDHPTEPGLMKWNFRYKGAVFSDEWEYVNGDVPTQCIEFLNGSEYKGKTVQHGDEVELVCWRESKAQGCEWETPSWIRGFKVIVEDVNYVPPVIPVAVYHFTNLQNLTGSSEPLKVKLESWGNMELSVFENLTTGEKVEGLKEYEMVAGNEYLLSCDIRGIEIDDSSQAYTWDFGPSSDTKDVFNMKKFMEYCTKFDGDLSNLDVSSVTTVEKAFGGDYWNNMSITFKGAENWNTSNFESMYGLCQYNTALTDLTVFKDWDVSKVADFQGCFQACKELQSAKAIEGWNTKSAENMRFTFSECNKMSGVSDLSEWCTPDIKEHGDFSRYCPDGTLIEPIWKTCPRGEDQ